MHVSKTFLQDTKQRGLRVRGKPDEVLADLHVEPDTTTLFEAFGIPEHGGGEAAFIEERWMQQVREGADFFANFADNVATFEQSVLDRLFLGIDQLGKAIEGHRQYGYFLTGRVVEIAGDAAALFVLKFQQARRKLAERELAANSMTAAATAMTGTSNNATALDTV